MAPPHVSVLMSVYNGQGFLMEAITSVLTQNFADFELIVVDDASTDQTPALLAGIKDARMRVLRQDKNAGLVAALNLAAAHAKAALLARMDADDVCLPDRLAKQVQAFVAQPRLQVLGTAFELMDANGVRCGLQEVLTSPQAIHEALMSANQVGHPTVMMRTQAFRQIGGYRSLGGRYAQDYDLWLRMSEIGEVANLAEPLLRYRVHEQQVSGARLLLQMKAAALYQELAKQRRGGHAEDLSAATRAVEERMPQLRDQCASEFIGRARAAAQRREAAEARRWTLRALRMSPWGHSVRSVLLGRIKHSLNRWLPKAGPRR